MAIARNLPRTYNDQTKNREAAVDLSGLQWCAVGPSGSATARVQAGKVTGQGALAYGILQNAPASGSLAEILERGYSQVRAYDTFNSGVELTPHDTNGKLEEAASGDYVIAIAEEASQCADAIITARIVDPYQKN